MIERPESDRVTGTANDLDMLAAHIEALHELAADPGQERDDDRVYDFSIRWGVLLTGRLERLAHYHHRGELPPQERVRYEALRDDLRDSMPQLERLGLPRPSIRLSDARSQ